jgi:hypothetical protein
MVYLLRFHLPVGSGRKFVNYDLGFCADRRLAQRLPITEWAQSANTALARAQNSLRRPSSAALTSNWCAPGRRPRARTNAVSNASTITNALTQPSTRRGAKDVNKRPARHQPTLWSLLPPVPDPHQFLQRQLPAALQDWELWRIDYAPKGYQALYRPWSIFTEVQPTLTAAIEQAYAIGFLTETLPLADLERMVAGFGGVLPDQLRRTLLYLERTYPTKELTDAHRRR